MSNNEIIADIKENFERFNTHKNEEVKPVLNTIIRLISRLNVTDKKDNLHLLKISSDLKSAGENEAQFFRLNNPENKLIQYSESFYKSINILKDELFKILNKL